MKKEIKVLIDVTTVDENTKDALAVEIKEETPIQEYNEGGLNIKGKDLVVVTKQQVNLGALKNRLSLLNERLIYIQSEIDTTQATIDEINPKLDEAIDTILAANPVLEIPVSETPVIH